MASKVLQLKEEYGEELAKLLNLSFETRASAQHYEGAMSKELEERLGPQESDRVRAAEAANWAGREIDKIRSKYIELELELRVAIDEALLLAERQLAPQDVSTEAVLLTTKMSEQELIDSMDAAAGLGDVGVETVKLCLAMARKKENFDMAIVHALELLPDLKDAYDDVLLAAEEPDPNDEPGEKWEQFAADSPTPQDILGMSGPQHDLNIYSRMR
jgi:F0F1-type ATP synthase membrane subunit b/b'